MLMRNKLLGSNKIIMIRVTCNMDLVDSLFWHWAACAAHTLESKAEDVGHRSSLISLSHKTGYHAVMMSRGLVGYKLRQS